MEATSTETETEQLSLELQNNPSHLKRASTDKLREIFNRYASKEINGEKYMTSEDFVRKYLGLFPDEDFNEVRKILMLITCQNNSLCYIVGIRVSSRRRCRHQQRRLDLVLGVSGFWRSPMSAGCIVQNSISTLRQEWKWKCFILWVFTRKLSNSPSRLLTNVL